MEQKAKPKTWPLWLPVLLGSIAAISLIFHLANPVSSPDLWWHMLHGRHILESGSLIIDHSIFTWTPAASYFPYTGWLGQIFLYLTYEFAGSTGLLALRYAIFFLIIILAWRYAISRGISTNPITWAIVAIAMALTWQAPLIKTELFTVGFFATTTWLYYHMRYKGDQAWRLPYLIPLILVIWVNTHGAFVVASLFFITTIIGEIFNIKFSPNQAMAPKLRKHYFYALGLCFPALFITPFGYDLPQLIISEILSQKGFHSRITGYVPTYLFNVPPYYLLDYLIMAMILFVLLIWQKLKQKQIDWVIILTFVGYSVIFTQLARVTFFLSPVFLFACLDMLASKEGSWFWPSTKLAKTVIAIISMSVVTLIGGRTVNDAYCKLFGDENGIKKAFNISASFPVEETEFIKRFLPGTKIGNMYRDGGYLEYHLWPDKKALIDTRYFPFRSWILDYFDFVDGIDIDKFVDNHPADFWLVNYKFANPFKWFKESDKWSLAFLGASGAIFIPTSDAPEKPIIASDIKDKITLENYAIVFRAAISLNDLTFARQIHRAAASIQDTSCLEHKKLTREMKETIVGYQAFNDGNYLDAAQILEKRYHYLFTQEKAADAMMKLAAQAWEKGDILSARNWYLNIFSMLKKVTFADIYNFTLIDWHYRFYNKDGFVKPTDNFHWQKFVVFMLTQEEIKLPSSHFITKTANAMKEGEYRGDAKLIPRNSITRSNIETKIKK